MPELTCDWTFNPTVRPSVAVNPKRATALWNAGESLEQIAERFIDVTPLDVYRSLHCGARRGIESIRPLPLTATRCPRPRVEPPQLEFHRTADNRLVPVHHGCERPRQLTNRTITHFVEEFVAAGKRWDGNTAVTCRLSAKRIYHALDSTLGCKTASSLWAAFTELPIPRTRQEA